MSPSVSVLDAIDERRLGAAGVTRYLNELDVDQVGDLLGIPTELKRYAESPPGLRPDGSFGPLWQPGDGRPWLADDDVAAMQALGRCVAGHLRERLGVSVTKKDGAIHPATCGFCDLVDDRLDDALQALAYAQWSSRFVMAQLLVWQGEDGSSYVRQVAGSRYENPRWSTFFVEQTAEQRRAAIDRAADREHAA